MNAHLGLGSQGLCRKASRTHVSIKAVVSGIFRLSWLTEVHFSLSLAMQLFRDFQIERLSDEEGRGRSNDRGLYIYKGQWLIFNERFGK